MRRAARALGVGVFGLLALLTLGACRKPIADPDLVRDPNAPDPGAVQAVAAGSVTGGVWTDARYPYTLRVLEGWELVPGTDGQNPRATVVHGETRARLEVSAIPGGALGPRPRVGCSWSFTDSAHYRALNVNPVTVATCTPDDPRHARILGYFLVRDGVAYDLEAVLPPGGLLAGKEATDQAVSAFRLR